MPSDPSVASLHRVRQLCEDQADDMRGGLGQVHGRCGRAGPGMAAAQDHARLLASVRRTDRQMLWSKVGINCLHLAVNVADHVRAIAGVTSAAADGGAHLRTCDRGAGSGRIATHRMSRRAQRAGVSAAGDPAQRAPMQGPVAVAAAATATSARARSTSCPTLSI